MNTLYVSDNSGGFTEAKDDDILAVGSQIASKQLTQVGVEFTNPRIAKKLLPSFLAGKDYEVFCVAFLDGGQRLISFEEMSRGTVMQTHVYVREVVRRALQLNAVKLIATHNHPGGSASPSKPDRMMTMKLEIACQMFDIELLDHFIVTGTETGSMREQGEMDPRKVIVGMMEEMAERMGAEIHTEVIDMDDKENFLEKFVKRMSSTKH